MNHFAYPQMFWLLLLPFLLRAVLPAVKGLHGRCSARAFHWRFGQNQS